MLHEAIPQLKEYKVFLGLVPARCLIRRFRLGNGEILTRRNMLKREPKNITRRARCCEIQCFVSQTVFLEASKIEVRQCRGFVFARVCQFDLEFPTSSLFKLDNSSTYPRCHTRSFENHQKPIQRSLPNFMNIFPAVQVIFQFS